MTYEVRSNPTREQCPLVRLRQSLEQSIQPDLINQSLRDRSTHHAPLTRDIIEQIRILQLLLERIQRRLQLIRDRRASLGTLETGVFLPETVELGRSILGDLLLDVLDVTLVEGRGFAVFEDHVVGVFV